MPTFTAQRYAAGVCGANDGPVSFARIVHLVRNILDRPAYVFRPSQMARRLAVALRPPRGTVLVRLPWDLDLAVDAEDAQGRAVLTSGIYDLPLSEALWRLTAPGDAVLDVGANIGYTTALLAVRTGARGVVRSYEPHPEVFARLASNAERWKDRPGLPRLLLRPVAVSGSSGRARLIEAEAFPENLGTSAISTSADSVAGRAIEVETITLDDELREFSGAVGVMKVDVEGHEGAVFDGARGLLRTGRVRDIVYEDHQAYPTSVSASLEGRGYRVLSIARTFFGPRLVAPTAAMPPRDRLPPNYLATRDPERAIRLMAPRGWGCLT